jgi:TP901 family phage tail tape measure protein
MKLSVWQLKLQDGVSRGLSSISSMSDKVSRKFTNTQTRISSFASRAKKDISDLTSQIPGLSGLGTAIMNPMVAAGAAIAIVATGFVTVTKKAAAFENQFLELRQLNLEKPNSELERLNDNVLKTAFNTGMLAKDTAKAYFDIQSATGKYGAEVDGIVEKTALFARATKTNFDSAIQSVGKAINAFGMDAKDMVKFFASSFKTVQVGITTFDQLAATQTDYAGAAAAANQSIDDANKLFAAFTQTAKSTREAGTLTKQTFNDLTRKSTIDGFKAIGVSLFDNAGQMKSLDTVTRELVPKLSTMSDLEFSRFKEAVGGSEGIRALLDRTKASGDSLLQTFDNFDSTKFDMAKALKNANLDATILWDILGNKIDTVLVRIGQKTLPNVISGFTTLIDKFDTTVNTIDQLNEKSELWSDTLSFIYNRTGFAAMERAWENISSFIDGINTGTDNIFHKIEYGYRGVKTLISTIAEASSSMFEGIGYALDRNFGMAAASLLDVKNQLSGISKIDFAGHQSAMAGLLDPGVAGDFSLPFPLRVPGGDAGGNGGGLAAGGGTVDPTDGINAVSGGGKSVRNVTVNIQKLVEGITINTSEVAGEMPDIEEMVTRALVRAVGGAEISLSS